MATTTVEPTTPQRGSGCAPAAGLALLVLGGALCWAWFVCDLSPWSALLALGVLLLSLGLLGLGPVGFSRRVFAAGTVLVLGPALARVAFVRGSEASRLTMLPGDSGPRLLSRTFPEPDVARVVAAVSRALGWTRDRDAPQLQQLLSGAFERARPSALSQPTPAIATYLGLQSPEGFDAVVIRPPEQRVAPDGAVVFLHGLGGSFYVHCRAMAEAAAEANLLVICPATGPSAAWWEEPGAETLLSTLTYAHDIGMNRIYLAGVAEGAAGASVLVGRYPGRFAGLVLVSGVRAVTPPPLPVLVVQGELDETMPARTARAYAARGSNVQYHALAGGHFVFLSEADQVRAVVARFLGTLERAATALPRR